MSDGSLSQDEIDALLQGTDTIEMDTGPEPQAGPPLSEKEIGELSTLLGSVVESQSSNLSMMTSKAIAIEPPSVSLVPTGEVGASLPDEVVEVKIDFGDGLSGGHSYLLSVDLATKIAGLMLGQEGVELDEMALSSLGEAISNITGPTTTTIGNRIGRMVQTEPASTRRASKEQIALPTEEYAVTATYSFGLEGEEPGQLIEVFSARMAKDLAAALGGSGAPAASQRQDMGGMFPGGKAGAQQTFGQALPGGGMMSQQSPPPNVQPVQFANLQPSSAPTNQGNIGLLMDVFMEMTVELGRTKRDIKYILTIGEGTIIELDKLAGEPVDILVNNKLIAKGEVVVIDENFGVRVTEIVSPGERMADLS